MPDLLFVDSDENLCTDVCSYFRSTGMRVEYALDFDAAATLLRDQRFDLVITDVAIAGGGILDLMRRVRRQEPPPVVLINSEVDTVDEAVRAVKEGAFGIVRKPFTIPELMFHTKRALDQRGRGQRSFAQTERFTNVYQPTNFIGECPEIKQVFDIVARVARTRSSVIITGETGTGKELIAGSIHYNSERSRGPFVRVNCAALPETLLESELFGYERGAFTGADRMRIGRFEQADGGTIFLDEVADMSLYTQAKVLRVLQEREFERVGGNDTIKSDVRIISATNKDLLQLMEEGKFREDLYYRLNVVTIDLPPLRDRGHDIQLLVQFFVRKYSLAVHRRIRSMHREAMDMLTRYHWPGNIRELENTIERAVLMTEGDVITARELRLLFARRPRAADGNEDDQITLPPEGVKLEEVEKSLIMQALEKSNWVQKDAATLLNVSGRVLNYKIKRFGITHSSWRQNR
ncbi:MAG: sigma-54-dependent Fis family transcriptional regulator [Spirochaetaceae bacterium]|nr:MAG: sigma-54-dependent Fis family transcriptional regulator [Spirochaetaceae bacterium]